MRTHTHTPARPLPPACGRRGPPPFRSAHGPGPSGRRDSSRRTAVVDIRRRTDWPDSSPWSPPLFSPITRTHAVPTSRTRRALVTRLFVSSIFADALVHLSFVFSEFYRLFIYLIFFSAYTSLYLSATRYRRYYDFIAVADVSSSYFVRSVPTRLTRSPDILAHVLSSSRPSDRRLIRAWARREPTKMPKIFLIKNRLHQQQQKLLENQKGTGHGGADPLVQSLQHHLHDVHHHHARLPSPVRASVPSSLQRPQIVAEPSVVRKPTSHYGKHAPRGLVSWIRRVHGL